MMALPASSAFLASSTRTRGMESSGFCVGAAAAAALGKAPFAAGKGLATATAPCGPTVAVGCWQAAPSPASNATSTLRDKRLNLSIGFISSAYVRAIILALFDGYSIAPQSL